MQSPVFSQVKTEPKAGFYWDHFWSYLVLCAAVRFWQTWAQNSTSWSVWCRSVWELHSKWLKLAVSLAGTLGWKSDQDLRLIFSAMEFGSLHWTFFKGLELSSLHKIRCDVLVNIVPKTCLPAISVHIECISWPKITTDTKCQIV